MTLSVCFRFLGCFLLVCTALLSNAQVRKPDLLYKKDKTILEAVIVEVSETEIQYRRFSNPQGPVYVVKKSEVNKIVYTNGETEELVATGKSDKKSSDKKVAEKKEPAKASDKKTAPKEKEVAKAKPVKEVKTKPEKAPKAPRADSEGITFKVGVRGGANLSTQTNNNAIAGAPAPGSNLGYHGGLVFNIGGKHFSVQPEVAYSQLGSKLEDNDFKFVGVYNTVTAPVLLKYTIGEGDLRFFINAGGYVSYGLSANTKLTDKSDNTSITSNNSDLDSEGRLQFGAVAGAGVTYMLGRTELFLDGRYYYGLGSNAPTEIEVGGNKVNVKQDFFNNIQVGVGVLIPLGK